MKLRVRLRELPTITGLEEGRIHRHIQGRLTSKPMSFSSLCCLPNEARPHVQIKLGDCRLTSFNFSNNGMRKESFTDREGCQCLNSPQSPELSNRSTGPYRWNYGPLSTQCSTRQFTLKSFERLPSFHKSWLIRCWWFVFHLIENWWGNVRDAYFGKK